MRKNNEIQIEIDDVYGCPGHCPGCVLSSLERKSIEPDMKEYILKASIDALRKFLPYLKDLEKINLTYGIGDHFLMPEEYLEKTFFQGSELIKTFNQLFDTSKTREYNGIFYSSSMIGKHEHIMKKVEFLKSLEDKYQTPAYILAVLDPKNLYHKKFSDVYQKNIIDANKILKRIDLSINLSQEAIQQISPQELFDFAAYHGFDEVTINWTPTDDNLHYSYMNNEILSSWLIQFFELSLKFKAENEHEISTSFAPVIMRTIDNLKCQSPEISTLHETIVMNFSELSHKSIQIDHKGNFFPKYEAIGDIGHHERFGFQASGNVLESSIWNGLQKSQMYHQAQMMKNSNFKQCQICPYQNYCANSGFHAYNKVIADKKKQKYIDIMLMEQIKENEKAGCWHPAKKLFSYFEKHVKDKD